MNSLSVVLDKKLTSLELKTKFDYLFDVVRKDGAHLGISLGLDISTIRPQFIVVSRNPISEKIIEIINNIK